MSQVAYTVCASFKDEPTAREYIAWLLGGHAQAVLAGGASETMLVRVEGQPDPFQVEVRYLFPNRQAFDRYVAEVAPALRVEGLRLFPPERGARFERRIGTVVGVLNG